MEEDSTLPAKKTKSSNMSGVLTPDCRRDAPTKQCSTSSSTSTAATLQVIQQRPMQTWLRFGIMASPFRNFLGLLRPPPLLAGVSTLDLNSPRASSATEIESQSSGLLKAEISSSSSSTSSFTGREGQSVVMVAFNATVKKAPHIAIVWAMEHVLNRGDKLTVVSVVDSVRGPLGYRVKIGDHNQKLVEVEVQQQQVEIWRNFQGLNRRCASAGVTLEVAVKAKKRGEILVCQEAMKLGACHVVLDNSLNNQHREYYLQNLSCNVTRMRQRGGVDVIRPSLDKAKVPRSPTSVLPPLRLSYGDQIDEFEIKLGFPKPKRRSTPKFSLRIPSPKYSSGELKLPSSAIARENSSSTSTSSVPSFVSAPSFTSSSHDDTDDDLFSIFHGSSRHAEVDAALLSIENLSSSGYESDNLFSIGNASSRRSLQGAASPLPELHHSHHLSFTTLPLLCCSPVEEGVSTSSMKE